MRRRGGGGELLGVGEVAKVLRVSTARIRQLRLAGRFIEEATVISGRRLYRRADVERFKRKREKPRT
jgi:DNA-binding transcriptional MerR regulator